MDPFSTLAAPVLYEQRVAEAAQRYRWSHSTAPARSAPLWQLIWLTALSIVGVR